MRASLLTKLSAAYLLPLSALLALMFLFGWSTVRGLLDEEIGERLADFAAAAATAQHAELIATLAPGDDGNRTHRNAIAKLQAFKDASDSLERLYIFTSDHRLLASTSTDDGPIGTPLLALGRDQGEIDWAFAERRAIASRVTFQGRDGHLYKSGYAPILGGDGASLAMIGVDASASVFSILDKTLGRLALISGLIGLAGLLAVYILGARWIVRPIRQLARAVSRIGRGNLTTEVPSSHHRDELGLLASGLDRMRQRLLAREQEQQMMLSGIAHEVRNPLGGIALFTGLLSEELSGDANKRAYVDKIQRELGHLERLVDDFLNYARDPNLERQPVALPALFDALAELMAPQLTQKRQRLTIELAQDLREGVQPPFMADEALLRRALLNLLLNASQAAPESGHIRLGARQRGNAILLSVQDDGPGLTPDIEAQMLTPFFTTKEKGIGLGLSLVSRFVTAHGGTLSLRPSERGAHFEIALPRHDPVAPAAPAKAPDTSETTQTAS